MALFRQVFVVNTNGEPVADKAGRIYDVADTEGATPLEIEDAGGIPIATVSVSAAGVNQSFAVSESESFPGAESLVRVRWISEDGLDHVIFESLENMEEQAASAVATAGSALDRVANFLQSVGVPGGVAALNSEGNVVDANQDVIGNDTRRAGAVTWAYGSSASRPTSSPDVMVIWITEGPAPENALGGVDVWLNAGVVL